MLTSVSHLVDLVGSLIAAACFLTRRGRRMHPARGLLLGLALFRLHNIGSRRPIPTVSRSQPWVDHDAKWHTSHVPQPQRTPAASERDSN